MKRRPSTSWLTTALPTLAALTACTQERHVNSPPVPERVSPPPPVVADSGVAATLPPEQQLDPRNLPPMPLAGAPMPVTPIPAPTPAPAPARAPSSARAPSPMSPAPMAAAAPAAPMAAAPEPAAPSRAPGLYIVHNHPPGTACHPISQTELQQAAQRVGGT